MCICLSPFHVIFFEASHWPSGHMIRSRLLIGRPSMTTTPPHPAPPPDQCGTNMKFLDDWLSEHICYQRYWTNEYPNIFGMIKISRMNIRINMPMKNQRIFLRMNIFVQNIRMYLNIRLFSQDCFGLFLPFSYFVLFWNHIEPFWTNNNNF